MAMQLPNQLERDPNKEYWTVVNGVPIQIPWGVMTHRQKELVLQYEEEAERRALHVALNNPCGLV